MKTVKKLMACLLAAAMMIGMSVPTFAADTVTITKEYNATDGTAPAENFEFTITNESVTDAADGITTGHMPAPTVSEASFTEGAGNRTADITVTLPEYKSVGIYTYKISETSANTAGVTYDTTPVYLKVTVTRDEQTGALKCDTAFRKGSTTADKLEGNAAFSNKYEAGTLSIHKDVTGNLGDTSKYFEFKVTLEAPEGKTVNSTIGVGQTSYASNPTSITIGEETTFYLHDGETFSLSNIPYGVTYTVTETKAEGYTTTVNNTEGNEVTNEVDEATETVNFVNDKNGEIDTGISLDSLPYILVFAGVAVAAVVMVVFRKRRYDD